MGKDHLNNWDGVTRMGCGFTEGKTKTLGSDFDTGRQSLPCCLQVGRSTAKSDGASSRSKVCL